MQELWHCIVDWITVIHIYDRYCKQNFTYLLRKSQRMSCQHLKSQSEFTKNSELPFWIFCMLTTWLRYNLATAKHLRALPLITLTSAKIFTTRWSFSHALFSTLKIDWAFRLCCYAFFICIFSKSSWQTVTGLSVSLLYHIFMNISIKPHKETARIFRPCRYAL